MRRILYIAILLILPFAPLHKLDISQLEPVEALGMRVVDNGIQVETDTGHRGWGNTVAEAVADIKEKTPGVIYMDTAKYLLLTEEAVVYAANLEPYLRDNIEVCIWDGEGSIIGAAEYLELRSDLPLFKDFENAIEKS